MTTRSPRTRWAAAAAASLLVLAACGSDGDTASTTPDPAPSTTAPTTSTAPAGSTPDSVPADVPTKIISLSPTGTEMLFAIGAGDQVIAVDDMSNHPPEALEVATDLSGFTPNVEAIAERKPDLVVIQPDASGELTAQLEQLGIEVFAGEAAKTFDDIYAQIEQLGAITGHVAEAAELVADMQTDIAKAVASAPKLEGATYFHEVDSTLYTISNSTFIAAAYDIFGLKNIAADATGDYPQLTNEAVIDADPDFIFLADADYGESAETVAARPGWGDIAAVKDGNVVAVSSDLSSRWGPRIVDYVEAISAALAKAPAPARA